MKVPVTLGILIILALGIGGLLWFMFVVPGKPYSGALKSLSAEERDLMSRLHRHVTTLAAQEHNLAHPQALEAAARGIEAVLGALGYAIERQSYQARGTEVRNIAIEIAGGSRREEIVIVGAHYDSVVGSPGANDNGSGVAALLELARLMRGSTPARTLRFVWFVNEEPPWFEGEDMGSRRYARRSRERGERVVAMLSLETIGWYSEAADSQRYPFPFGLFYPSRGNFLGFVSNLPSRALLHQAIAAFRRHAEFPSEGGAAPAFIPGVAWSDHASFWEQGYPAIMLTDTAPFRYPWYHSAQDTPDKVDYARLARVLRGLHGMLRELTD